MCLLAVDCWESAGFTLSAATGTCSENKWEVFTVWIIQIKWEKLLWVWPKSYLEKLSKVWPFHSGLVLSWQVALMLMCPETIHIKQLYVDFPRNSFICRRWWENNCIFTWSLPHDELESRWLSCVVTAAWSKSQSKCVGRFVLKMRTIAFWSLPGCPPSIWL